MIPRQEHWAAIDRLPGQVSLGEKVIFPIVLGDGRPLFLLPPEGETAGKLLIAHGKGFAAVPLTVESNQTVFKRGTLLDGVEERSPGVLGAWVLSGWKRSMAA